MMLNARAIVRFHGGTKLRYDHHDTLNGIEIGLKTHEDIPGFKFVVECTIKGPPIRCSVKGSRNHDHRVGSPCCCERHRIVLPRHLACKQPHFLTHTALPSIKACE